MADHAVEAMVTAHRAPQAVAFGRQRAALAFRLAGGMHAAGDQVRDHLQKTGAFLQPLIAARWLRRQYTAVLFKSRPDWHPDKRQFPIVQLQPVQKAWFNRFRKRGSSAMRGNTTFSPRSSTMPIKPSPGR